MNGTMIAAIDMSMITAEAAPMGAAFRAVLDGGVWTPPGVDLSAPVDHTAANVAPAYADHGLVQPYAPREVVHAQAPPSPRLSQGPPQTA